jgi:hypothetical protein
MSSVTDSPDRYSGVAPVSGERVQVREALGLFATVLHCGTKMEAGLEARLELPLNYLQTSERVA